MIAIDTDILSIYHIFKNDPRFKTTSTFIKKTKEIHRAITIFNLLELCGIISTAKRCEEAQGIFEGYFLKKDMKILYPRVNFSSKNEFFAVQNVELMNRISRGMRLGDASILWVVESNTCNYIVTWNKRQFTHIHHEIFTDHILFSPKERLGEVTEETCYLLDLKDTGDHKSVVAKLKINF